MHTLLKTCTNCDTLKELYAKIECTILYLAKNKNNSLKYNVDTYFNQDDFNSLVRYKRIVARRMVDCDYPSPCIKTADIISYITKLAFRSGNCSVCEDCFPELGHSNSSSSSSSTTSNTP